jgi:hypothetical protein
MHDAQLLECGDKNVFISKKKKKKKKKEVKKMKKKKQQKSGMEEIETFFVFVSYG